MKLINTITLPVLLQLASINTQMVSSEGPCQLESVFNECVERGKLFLSYCPADDTVCQCRKNQDILMCFQRCYSNDSRYSGYKNSVDSHCPKVPESQKNQTLIIPPPVSGTNSSETGKPTPSASSSSSSATDSASASASASTIIVSKTKNNSSSSSSSSGAGESNTLTPISFVAFLALLFL
ncbi:hypothetical protein CONCODRAFT_3484 [Conidiobolus coronatus NRRL 28638]|uniref:Extracellular membrane protein CFEM domain-containing protein n=1 Tax=Conidiobolus coronatus (strain ATCC 28846 / CBS 209.66 / NRRL 28638) TaxID=796925 RepID=A0A137PEU6_CONC2|nr:hypothetical protein CONCODRAFT_3484 [Conidiobolus coronatus NRRL 28638]|eukprot:KXN73526.1 hypothetical protein CONCODRAFT_3484 [Conidiobolus coronatus NRRL 28638]